MQQPLSVEEATRLQFETNLDTIRTILSLHEDVTVGQTIDAIISHPDGRIQEETCHLLAMALGPKMPWRDIVDVMRSFEEYPHDNFLEYATAMAQTTPAPWSKTLATIEESHRIEPGPSDMIYQMMVTSMDSPGAKDRETSFAQSPATQAWGICNLSPDAYFPGRLVDQSYRMMACNRYLIPGEEDLGESWFTGMCQGCESEIPNMGSALRHPLNDGGWMGCFCGFRCLAQASPHEELFKLTALEMMEGCPFSFAMAQHQINLDDKVARAMLAEKLEEGGSESSAGQGPLWSKE